MQNDTYDFWEYFESASSEAPAVTVPTPEQGFVLPLYGALLCAGAVGNAAVFTSLLRSRRRKSRVNLLMTHLAVADLIVTCVVIPLEIGWRTTNAWIAGNLACKFFLVLRAFGLYLSSNVLVCISLDRFFAVLYPLRLAVARSRSKTMLSCAWIIALFCSLPQSLVFRVLRHPEVPEFQQCVSFDAFPSHRQELAYNVFCLCAMYFLPLLIITVCYGCIFYEISKNSKEISDKAVSDHSRIQLRRSDRRPLARARRRTLRMTVTIVAVFACCWLPYATMTLWYMVDRESAIQVSARLQDLFFIMAVSNSCMDPLVYGTYALNLKAIFSKTFKKIFCIHPNSNEITRISAHATLKTKLPVNDLQPASARCSSVRRHRVRFQETSLGGPSVTSDPVPCWRSHSDEDHKIKPSRSCEEPLAIVMPTILYHSSSSPPSRAVKMVAGILGVALEERYLNPVARDQDTPELTEKNPMRSVPLLDEGDYSLADSHAIIVYLFDKYGKPEDQHLYPTDIRKRATINQRMYFECGILFPRLRSVMAPTFWGKLTELTKPMKSNMEDAYRTLEAYLSRTAYVADDRLTLADISIVTTVSTMDGVHPVDAKRYPKLKQWLLTMSQKDFCQKYNEPGKDELVTILVTMMKNNKHNQQSKL